MGYYLTTEPENAVPGKSWVIPKTHTPGSPVKERGLRYYVPEVGRWTARDPVGEDAFRYSLKQTNPKVLPADDDAQSISEDEQRLLLRLGFSPWQIMDAKKRVSRRVDFAAQQKDLYLFVANNPIREVDSFGLCLFECARDCIFDQAGSSRWGLCTAVCGDCYRTGIPTACLACGACLGVGVGTVYGCYAHCGGSCLGNPCYKYKPGDL